MEGSCGFIINVVSHVTKKKCSHCVIFIVARPEHFRVDSLWSLISFAGFNESLAFFVSCAGDNEKKATQ